MCPWFDVLRIEAAELPWGYQNLQTEGGVGKKNVTDGSEWVYSVAQSQDRELWHFDQRGY